MLIRALTLADFERGFCESLSHLRPTCLSPEREREVFERIKRNPDHHIFVADDGDQVVGTITLLIEPKFIHQGGLVGHIEDVSVHKAQGGKGYGRALMDYAIEFAEQQGCYKVILDCDDHMVDYYQNCGFHYCANAMRRDL